MVFSWKITAKKVLIQIVIVGIAGIAATYGNNPYYLAIAPLLQGLLNIVKHWND